MKNTKKGFTLVELLVVIAILAILASVAVVGYTSFIEKAERSNAQTELHQLETSVEANLMVGDDTVLGTGAGNVTVYVGILNDAVTVLYDAPGATADAPAVPTPYTGTVTLAGDFAGLLVGGTLTATSNTLSYKETGWTTPETVEFNK